MKPKSLDELFAGIQAGSIKDNDFNEWQAFPSFGGTKPKYSRGVFSWDKTRVLIGNENLDMKLVSRAAWNKNPTFSCSDD